MTNSFNIVLKKLSKPAMTVILLGTLMHFEDMLISESRLEETSPIFNFLHYGLAITFSLFAGWLVVKIMEVIFWHPMEKYVLEDKASRLLKDISTILIFLIVIICIGVFIFDQPVTWFWATSGVVALIIGFALKSLIFDFFASIALSVEQSFKVNDWVRIERRGFTPFVGRVTEINWRSTKFFDTDNVMVTVPNGELSTMVFANLTRPEAKSRFEVKIRLDFEVPTERAIRVLLSGARAAWGPLEDPAPKVRINEIGDWGVEYKIRYWLIPSIVSPNKGRHSVYNSVLQHLHHAGISIAHPKQDIFLNKMPTRQFYVNQDKMELISRMRVFKLLNEEEKLHIANNISERKIKSRQTLRGEDFMGGQINVLVEGLLHVTVESSDNSQTKFDQIIPGEFFSDISLLTKENESVTISAATDSIVYTIDTDIIQDLLNNRTDFVGNIYDILTSRSIHKLPAKEIDPSIDVLVNDPKKLAEHIKDRLKFFLNK